MGFKIKPWMKAGRHYTPNANDPGYEEYMAGDSRAAKQRALGSHPKPIRAPEPKVVEQKSVVRKAAESTVNAAEIAIETTASVATATVKAPIKVAGAVAGATLEGTKAVAGATINVASAGAGAAIAGADAIIKAPLNIAKAATNALRRKPSIEDEEETKDDDEVPETPKESLAPSLKVKTGGFISGMECEFCGKTYRLERYFLPHVEKCPLNPTNIRA